MNILLITIFSPLGTSAQTKTISSKKSISKSDHEKVICIKYESIHYKVHSIRKQKYKYTVKTTEILWYLLRKKFDLDVFKNQKEEWPIRFLMEETGFIP